MASAVASKVEIPKPVFLMGILGSPSPSASRKTAASACHVLSTGGAPPRSSDGVKDSTGKVGVNDTTGKDGVKDSTGKDGVKGSTGKDAAAADRRPEREPSIPKLFVTGDVLDRFPEAAMRDLLQALALAEDADATGFSPRGSWVSKEDGDAVQLKVAMPGLAKEHVKMRVEKDVLVIKGKGDKDSEGDGDKGRARYTYRIGLPSQAFKMDQIKAEMKNGMLILTMPKIKDEERKDVFEIKVE